MTVERAPRTGLYAGTFDPITFGHLDLVHRALALFDSLIIAIAENPAKTPLFSAEERRALILECLPTLEDGNLDKRVEVLVFDGLLADLARDRKVTAFLRGLRAVSDFEFEFQMALTNRALVPEVEAVYLMPNAKYSYLSSSVIKDVARHGGDVSKFVPSIVAQRMAERFALSKQSP